jgi:hypothetical protein
MAITIATNPPNILCFTEHHLKTYQLDNIFFPELQTWCYILQEHTQKWWGLYIYSRILSILYYKCAKFVKKKIWKFVELNYNCQIVLLAY